MLCYIFILCLSVVCKSVHQSVSNLQLYDFPSNHLPSVSWIGPCQSVSRLPLDYFLSIHLSVLSATVFFYKVSVYHSVTYNHFYYGEAILCPNVGPTILVDDIFRKTLQLTEYFLIEFKKWLQLEKMNWRQTEFWRISRISKIRYILGKGIDFQLSEKLNTKFYIYLEMFSCSFLEQLIE